jgi:adenylyl-sulfate kinase
MRGMLASTPHLLAPEWAIQAPDRLHLMGHPGRVVWLTGLSGAGKSTLASALEASLHVQGIHTAVLDGDQLRLGLCRGLGFSDEDRHENVRRAAEVAKLMCDAGLVVLVSLISPLRAHRALARDLIGTHRFTEVYVNTPLSVCEGRDPKGLYLKARQGLIQGMTGLDSPYEPPEAPDVQADGANPDAAVVVRLLAEAVLHAMSAQQAAMKP